MLCFLRGDPSESSCATLGTASSHRTIKVGKTTQIIWSNHQPVAWREMLSKKVFSHQKCFHNICQEFREVYFQYHCLTRILLEKILNIKPKPGSQFQILFQQLFGAEVVVLHFLQTYELLYLYALYLHARESFPWRYSHPDHINLHKGRSLGSKMNPWILTISPACRAVVFQQAA